MKDPKKFFDIIEFLTLEVTKQHNANIDTSYTAKLLAEGKDAIAQKVGEEAVEVVIEAVNGDKDKLAEESADLLYHLVVLWFACGASPEDIAKVIEKRAGKSGLQEKADRTA